MTSCPPEVLQYLARIALLANKVTRTLEEDDVETLECRLEFDDLSNADYETLANILYQANWVLQGLSGPVRLVKQPS